MYFEKKLTFRRVSTASITVSRTLADFDNCRFGWPTDREEFKELAQLFVEYRVEIMDVLRFDCLRIWGGWSVIFNPSRFTHWLQLPSSIRFSMSGRFLTYSGVDSNLFSFSWSERYLRVRKDFRTEFIFQKRGQESISL